MPTEIKLIIEDNALPIVQQACEDRNAFLINSTLPRLTLDEFVQWAFEDHFAIHREQIEFRAVQQQKERIISQIDQAKVETLKDIETAVADVIAKET